VTFRNYRLNPAIVISLVFVVSLLFVSDIVSAATIYAGTSFGSGGEIYKSSDGGSTWTLSASSITLDGAIQVRSIIMDSDGTVYASVVNTNGGEIYKSDDGTTWQKLASAATLGGASCIDSLLIDIAGNIYAAVNGTNIVIYKSSDGGSTWNITADAGDLNNPISLYDLQTDAQGNIYAVVEDNDGAAVYWSEDNGGSWSRIADRYNLGDAPCFYDYHSSLLGTDSSGNIFVASYTEEVYKSADKGSTWTKVAGTTTFVDGHQLPVLIIDSMDNIYVGRAPWSGESGHAAIFESTTGGTSWTSVADTTTYIPSTASGIWALAADNDGNIFAGTNHPAVILRKQSGSSTWSVVASTNTALAQGVTRISAIGARSAGTTETIDPNSSEIVTLDTTWGEVSVEFQAQTFSEPVSITVSEVATADLPEIPSSQSDLKATGIAIDITLSKSELKVTKPVTITIPYRESDVVGMDKGHLGIARYDDTNQRWIPLPSEVDTESRKVTGHTMHLSKFQIVEMSPASTLDVAVWPNPWSPTPGSSSHAPKITFSGLTSDYTLKIFTVAGDLVFQHTETSSSGKYYWTPANEKGQSLASGVYVWAVTGPDNSQKHGKLIIIP